MVRRFDWGSVEVGLGHVRLTYADCGDFKGCVGLGFGLHADREKSRVVRSGFCFAGACRGIWS